MDLCLCTNKTCLLRSDCYRYRAIPDPYLQNYGSFEYDKENNKCSYQLPMSRWVGREVRTTEEADDDRCASDLE